MSSNEEKRVLVVKARRLMSQEDRRMVQRTLLRELEDGVVLSYLEFCCLASADEVYIMHDDLFPCDPDKNDRCHKTNCYRNGGDCYMTQFEDCRK